MVFEGNAGGEFDEKRSSTVDVQNFAPVGNYWLVTMKPK